MDLKIVDHLVSQNENTALVLGQNIVTYSELVKKCSEWDKVWDSLDVNSGTVVSLHSEYNATSCSALISLFDRKAIVIPLGKLPAQKEEEYLSVAEPEISIRIDEEGTWRHDRPSHHRKHELYQKLQDAQHGGIVLFSSGTTGKSKATVLDFNLLVGAYRPKVQRRRTLAFMAIDHIGGINTLLHTLIFGGAVVTVPTRTPDAVFACIEKHQVDTLPTTPTFLTMALVSGAIKSYDTSSIKLVTYGSEPMPESILQRAKEALPQAKFKQTYGLSELGIIPTRSKSDGSLWIKLSTDGFEYDIRDGILWVRAQTAMLGYLNAPSPFDENGFFNTQDRIETDGEYVRILGRKSDLINVGGEKVYPIEIESYLLKQENVEQAAVFGKPSVITGQMVVARVKLKDSSQESEKEAERRILESCRNGLESYKVPATIFFSQESQHTTRFKKVRA